MGLRWETGLSKSQVLLLSTSPLLPKVIIHLKTKERRDQCKPEEILIQCSIASSRHSEEAIFLSVTTSCRASICLFHLWGNKWNQITSLPNL